MTFKPIEELTFTDDFMFGYVLRDPEICKTLLETLLGIQIEHLEYPALQENINSFYESKGVRLDVYVKDSSRVFDIEIQNIVDESIAKRTRYYQSMVDIDNLLKGEEYTNLKESFIIFICQFDPFDAKLPCYTFKSICKENTNIELNDKTSKIIFNSTAYDKEKDVEISAFLKYIKTQEATNDFTNKLKTFVEKAKHNKELRSYYLSMNIHDSDIRRVAFQEGKDAGISQGLQQGAEQKAIETAKNMIQKKLNFELIAECTSLPLEKIQQLAKELQQSN